MANVQSLTAAVIGTGFIGPVHVEALQRIGVRVKGILGSTDIKSRQAACDLGLEQGYASLDALLADKEVDVVHVTSPNRFHFEQASRSLQAGKHVLCEKPLAMNSAESAELMRIAADFGKLAGVNYNIRYYPLCLEAAAQMQQGELGQLFRVDGSYVQDWLFHNTDFNWRVLEEDGGELRAVADIGTHWLDLIQFITGQKVIAVCADLQTVHAVRQWPLGGIETFSGQHSEPQDVQPVDVATEDAGSVLLKFSGGGRGTLQVSQVTAGRKNCLRFELACSRKAVEWCSERPNEMWVGYRDQPNQMLLRDPSLLGERAAQFADYPGGHNQGFADTFKQLFRDFYSCLANGGSSSNGAFPAFKDGHHEILLCEAIIQSHREQRWVQVGSQSFASQ